MSMSSRMRAQRKLAVVLLVVAGVAAADSSRLLPDGFAVERYLASPPPPGSVAANHDLQALLALQRGRTAADVADARADQEVSVFRFADVMGPSFTAARLPRTAALAQRACRESSRYTAAAKRYWNRPRPFVASAEVEPVLRKSADGSYPSGHATCGYLWAILLSEMLPEQRAAIFERGLRYGRNRAVGGVHYPSDVEAGRIAAAAIATAMFSSESFRRDFEAARAETRATLIDAAALAH